MQRDVALDGVAGAGVHDGGAAGPHALYLRVRVLVARRGAARDGAHLAGQLAGHLGDGAEAEGEEPPGVVVGRVEAHVLEVGRVEVVAGAPAPACRGQRPSQAVTR